MERVCAVGAVRTVSSLACVATLETAGVVRHLLSAARNQTLRGPSKPRSSSTTMTAVPRAVYCGPQRTTSSANNRAGRTQPTHDRLQTHFIHSSSHHWALSTFVFRRTQPSKPAFIQSHPVLLCSNAPSYTASLSIVMAVLVAGRVPLSMSLVVLVVVVGLCLLSSSAQPPSASSAHQLHVLLTSDRQMTGRAVHPDTVLRLVLALQEDAGRLAALRQLFDDVHSVSHPSWLQHLSAADMHDRIGVDESVVHAVNSWLTVHGGVPATNISWQPSGTNVIIVHTTVAAIDSMFNTSMGEWRHREQADLTTVRPTQLTTCRPPSARTSSSCTG